MSASSVPVPAKQYAEATRELTSVLAPLERRVLLFLAHRLPHWVTSDQLTGLALVAMIGAGGAFWLAASHPIGLALVVVCLAVNWFGDSLDGTLARVRQQQRPRYGYYVDHVVDAIGTACLIGGLALSGYMSPTIALGLLVAYIMLASEVYLATHSLGTFTMSYFKVGPTELRIILSIGTLMLYVRPTVRIFGEAAQLFNVGGSVAIVGMILTFLMSAARNTRILFRLEPISRREAP